MLITIWSVVMTFLFYFALIGWGWLIAHLIHYHRSMDIGLYGALGMALTAIMGGVMNLLGVISPSLAKIYVLLGIGVMFILIFMRRHDIIQWFIHIKPKSVRARTILNIAISVLIVFIILYGVAAGSKFQYNHHDDHHAYLVFPYKMLGAGSLELEPFNERRLLALGGQSILQAFLMGAFNTQKVCVADMGLGWLVFIGLILSHCIYRRLSPYHIVMILLAIHLIQLPIVNVSSVCTGIALFYALIYTFIVAQPKQQFQKLFMISLIAAGLCSLKSSHILACGLLILLIYLIGENQTFMHKVKGLAIIALLCALFLLPWMINMYQSNGTLLFPLLGKGYHGSAYSTFPDVSCGVYNLESLGKMIKYLIKDSAFILSFVLVVLPFIVASEGRHNHRTLAAAFLATWIAAIVLDFHSGLQWRYDFAFTFTFLTFQIVEFISLRGIQTHAVSRYLYSLIGLAIILVIFTYSYWPSFRKFDQEIQHMKEPEKLWEKSEMDYYRNFQQVVPLGQKILARLSKPFLLDFSRNRIFTVDWPGGSGPPPGLPCLGTAEQLADYLRSQSIWYIMYSYREEANFTYRQYSKRLRFNRPGYRNRVMKLAQYTFGFQERLIELARHYKAIYLDNYTVVIDLNDRSSM